MIINKNIINFVVLLLFFIIKRNIKMIFKFNKILDNIWIISKLILIILRFIWFNNHKEIDCLILNWFVYDFINFLTIIISNIINLKEIVNIFKIILVSILIETIILIVLLVKINIHIIISYFILNFIILGFLYYKIDLLFLRYIETLSYNKIKNLNQKPNSEFIYFIEKDYNYFKLTTTIAFMIFLLRILIIYFILNFNNLSILSMILDSISIFIMNIINLYIFKNRSNYNFKNLIEINNYNEILLTN